MRAHRLAALVTLVALALLPSALVAQPRCRIQSMPGALCSPMCSASSCPMSGRCSDGRPCVRLTPGDEPRCLADGLDLCCIDDRNCVLGLATCCEGRCQAEACRVPLDGGVRDVPVVDAPADTPDVTTADAPEMDAPARDAPDATVTPRDGSADARASDVAAARDAASDATSIDLGITPMTEIRGAGGCTTAPGRTHDTPWIALAALVCAWERRRRA